MTVAHQGCSRLYEAGEVWNAVAFKFAGRLSSWVPRRLRQVFRATQSLVPSTEILNLIVLVPDTDGVARFRQRHIEGTVVFALD
jgi:hypothetical protein